MENVRTILMNLNSIYFFSVDITCYMFSLFNYSYFFATFCCFMSKYRSI